jgi:hypothetical protein
MSAVDGMIEARSSLIADDLSKTRDSPVPVKKYYALLWLLDPYAINSHEIAGSLMEHGAQLRLVE